MLESGKLAIFTDDVRGGSWNLVGGPGTLWGGEGVEPHGGSWDGFWVDLECGEGDLEPWWGRVEHYWGARALLG